MEQLNTNLTEENFHDNIYDVLYIDDIAKLKKQKNIPKNNNPNKKQKKVKKEISKDTTKIINKLLNIFIVISVIGIIFLIINMAFAEQINTKIKEPIEAYFVNKEIEKEAAAGNLIPASELEAEDTSIEWNEDTSLINPTNSESKESKETTTSFLINDKTIYNFNENVLINIPDPAYVQSSNENKVLMLNSEKIYEMVLNCLSYEVFDNSGKYVLIIHSQVTNTTYPDKTSLEGILTANIENEIITSNKNNTLIKTGEVSDIDISFDLTEKQYKLIKNELDSINFTYRDKYNYREIFATYGGNYSK